MTPRIYKSKSVVSSDNNVNEDGAGTKENTQEKVTEGGSLETDRIQPEYDGRLTPETDTELLPYDPRV